MGDAKHSIACMFCDAPTSWLYHVVQLWVGHWQHRVTRLNVLHKENTYHLESGIPTLLSCSCAIALTLKAYCFMCAVWCRSTNLRA